MNGKKQCSFPYQNPDDRAVALECSDEKQCGEGQRCVLNAYAQLLCCTIKEALLEDRSELVEKELAEIGEYSLDTFCGPDYVPLLDVQKNEPVGCHPFKKPCALRQICQYTPITRGYICCFKVSPNPDTPVHALRNLPKSSAVDEEFYSLEK